MEKQKNKCIRCNNTEGKLIKCCICKDYFCGNNHEYFDIAYGQGDIENSCLLSYYSSVYEDIPYPSYTIFICRNCRKYLFNTCILCGKKRPGYYCGDNKYCHNCECVCNKEGHYSDDEDFINDNDVKYAKKDIINIKKNLKLLKKKIMKYSLGDVNLINLIKEYLIYYY